MGALNSGEVQQYRNLKCVQQCQKLRIFENVEYCLQIVGYLFEYCFVLEQNREENFTTCYLFVQKNLARCPSKLVYIGAEGAFRKILGLVGLKWVS